MADRDKARTLGIVRNWLGRMAPKALSGVALVFMCVALGLSAAGVALLTAVILGAVGIEFETGSSSVSSLAPRCPCGSRYG